MQLQSYNRHRHGLLIGVIWCCALALAGLATAAESTIMSWQGRSLGDFGRYSNYIDNLTTKYDFSESSYVMTGTIVGNDPIIYTKLSTAIIAKPSYVIEVTLKVSDTGTSQVFWRNETEAFSESRQKTFLLTGDSKWHTYRLKPHWSNGEHIAWLRLDLPGYEDAGMTFALKSVAIIDAPVESIDVAAAEHEGVAFDLTMPAGVHYCELVWSSTEVEEGKFQFSPATDGKAHRYWLRLKGEAKWRGTIDTMSVCRNGANRIEEELAATNMEFTRAKPSMPADVVLMSASANEAIPRAGRRFTVEAVVRNFGTEAARGLRFAFEGLPSGVRVINANELSPPGELPGTDGVETIGSGKGSKRPLVNERVYRFTLTDLGVGEHDFTLNLSVGGAKTSATIHAVVRPSLSLAKASYVPEPQPISTAPYKVGAYLFPGWTSHRWHAVRSKEPWRKPVLGWYDEEQPETIDWQIKQLAENGISYVLVDWYWNRGTQHLNHWMESFKLAKHRKYLKWAVMWANHNGDGSHSAEDQELVTRYWIKEFFRDPQYLKTASGEPIVVIYQPGQMEADMAGQGGCKALLDLSRRLAKAAGLPGIHFVGLRSGDVELASMITKIENMGIDSTSVYTYLGNVAGMRTDDDGWTKYSWVADSSYDHWCKIAGNGKKPILPLLSTSTDSRLWLGCEGRRVSGYNTNDFRRVCQAARRYADEHADKLVENMLLLGPLDEWGEGEIGYPNAEHGFGILEAVRETFATKPSGGWPTNFSPEDVGLGCPQRSEDDLDRVSYGYPWVNTNSNVATVHFPTTNVYQGNTNEISLWFFISQGGTNTLTLTEDRRLPMELAPYAQTCPLDIRGFDNATLVFDFARHGNHTLKFTGNRRWFCQATTNGYTRTKNPSSDIIYRGGVWDLSGGELMFGYFNPRTSYAGGRYVLDRGVVFSNVTVTASLLRQVADGRLEMREGSAIYAGDAVGFFVGANSERGSTIDISGGSKIDCFNRFFTDRTGSADNARADRTLDYGERIRVSGGGSTIRAQADIHVGHELNGFTLEVADDATLSTAADLWIGYGSAHNLLVADRAAVSARQVMFGSLDLAVADNELRLENGARLDAGDFMMGMYGANSRPSTNNRLFVGDGSTLNVAGQFMNAGADNEVTVSNGTIVAGGKWSFYIGYADGNEPQGTDCLRNRLTIMGDHPKIRLTSAEAHGYVQNSGTLTFVLPDDGNYREVPIVSDGEFTIARGQAKCSPAESIIEIRNYGQIMKSAVETKRIPLIRAKSFAFSSFSVLNANLPQGCSLVVDEVDGYQQLTLCIEPAYRTYTISGEEVTLEPGFDLPTESLRLSVADGGVLHLSSQFRSIGDNNRLTVSDGTVSVRGLRHAFYFGLTGGGDPEVAEGNCITFCGDHPLIEAIDEDNEAQLQIENTHVVFELTPGRLYTEPVLHASESCWLSGGCTVELRNLPEALAAIVESEGRDFAPRDVPLMASDTLGGVAFLEDGDARYALNATLPKGCYIWKNLMGTKVSLHIAPEGAERFFGGGFGSRAQPFVIDSECSFEEIQTRINGGLDLGGAHFRQEGPLDLRDWKGLCANYGGWLSGCPFAGFAGHYDGNGQSVRVTFDDEARYAGVFSTMMGGSVANLAVTIDNNESNPCIGAAGIVGVMSEGMISNCVVTGRLVGKESCGGVAVRALGSGKFVDCVNRAKITGGGVVGGIVAEAFDNPYSTVKPKCAEYSRNNPIRTLFFGNSITRHSPSADLGWTGDWGMAASSPANDYVHLVCRGLETRLNRRVESKIVGAYGFENGFRSWQAEDIADSIAFKPQIVVLALGENAQLQTDLDYADFKAAFRRLVAAFAELDPKPAICVRGVFWTNERLDGLLQSIAEEFGVVFVKANVASQPGMTAKGLFEHEGVANHPGDAGMAEIARRIIDDIFAFFANR